MQPVLPWQLPDGVPTPSLTRADLEALRDRLESSWIQGEAQLRGATGAPHPQGDTRPNSQARLAAAVIDETGPGSLLLLRTVQVDEAADCAPEPIPRVTARPRATQALRRLLEELSRPAATPPVPETIQLTLQTLRRDVPALEAPVNLTSLGALLGLQAELTRQLWREGPECRASLAGALTRQVCALMRQAEDEVNRNRPGLHQPDRDQALLIRAGWLGLRALLGARADRALLDEARLQQSARRSVLHAGLDPQLPPFVRRQNEAALPGLLRTSVAMLISGLKPEVTLLGPVVNLAHLRAQHQASQGRSGPGQTRLGRSGSVSLSMNLLSLSWPGSRRMRPLETRAPGAAGALQ